MPYFTSNSLKLYYEDTGSGPPLLLFPPPALGSSPFIPQQEALPDGIRLLTFHPRGNGYSETDGEETIRSWADDAAALLDHLDIQQASLCGYSMGGAPVQDFAIRYPERTACLLLLCTFPEVNTKLLEKKISLGELLTQNRWTGFLGRALGTTHSARTDIERNVWGTAEQSDPEAIRRLYTSGRHFTALPQLASVQSPVYYIYGRWDPIALPYVNQYKSVIPHARFIRISEGFHQLPTRASSQVNSIIRSIVREEETPHAD
ncbi:alpha/beta fold hydrolase [Alkalicoccus luteus]|uniref:Alpha/beta hydrolase n=1 Tax=Alkalicoccus luteus TaxID=1237094 RepID=A0A969PTJ9_9BACI|nr:alpha/beta hydrolase [Alkalicoccus luteus]NJP38131.1 alpha/beta hydrolase [Alkalicoccus luteus]